MQEENHLFQGLRRDNHPIRQDGKFLWDAYNIRLTDREDNTYLSITNEKGTHDTGIKFKGLYVGHCVLGNYLIVFTANDDSTDNYIYRLENTPDGYKTRILFHEENSWEGSWNPNHPIEALGVYETELVQKVYWVDGVNQPRMINITKPEYKLQNTKYASVIEKLPFWDYSNPLNNIKPTEYTDEEWTAFINDYKKEYSNIYIRDSFDFVRNLKLEETVLISKKQGSGEFPSGTIQYAFTYYDKYGQESNIWHTTPLYYTSPPDRAGSPEEKVSNSFHITIINPDTQFEYIRVYSIQRTSIDATPTVKVVTNIHVKNYMNTDKIDAGFKGNYLEFTDTGTIGYTVDNYQLLYIGGESIIANCLTEKDRTLFLGNIETKQSSIYNKVKDIIKTQCRVGFINDYRTKPISLPSKNKNSYYDYTPQLNTSYNAGFKCGETYRCGIQFQTVNGKWSEPIFIDDKKINEKYPWEEGAKFKSLDVEFNDKDTFNNLYNIGVRKMRACVVFPKASEREVICQGVLCPTVFKAYDRENNSPYACSSWFFRPDSPDINSDNLIFNGAPIQFRHNRALITGNSRGTEIQNMSGVALEDGETGTTNKEVKTLADIVNNSDLETYGHYFFVDENIVTFHSPDIEFDTTFGNYIWNNVKLRIIGRARLGAIIGDIDIRTSSPAAGKNAKEFEHHMIGYQTNHSSRSIAAINGGLISGLFYNDVDVTEKENEKDGAVDYIVGNIYNNWMIYPWHKSGSLNNDVARSNGSTRTAMLSRKKISNLKFFDYNFSLENPLNYDISAPQLFNSNEVSLIQIPLKYIKEKATYYGNVDSISTSNKLYKLYRGQSFSGHDKNLLNDEDNVYSKEHDKSREPIRIKYKSTPHLVFSLENLIQDSEFTSFKDVPILPIYGSTGTAINENIPSIVGSQFTPGNTTPKYDGLIWLSGYGTPVFELMNSNDIPDDKLGYYSVGKNMFIGDVKDIDNRSIYKVETHKEEGKDKKTQARVLRDKGNGIILKTEKGVTKLREADAILPGTKIEDYDSNLIYQGIDKYYRLDYGIIINGKIHVYEAILTDITPDIQNNNTTDEANNESNFKVKQKLLGGEEGVQDGPRDSYVFIGELVREVPVKFGGFSPDILQQHMWLPGGRAISITEDKDHGLQLPIEYGDTWYSRYDCLKTYPFTQEDENQVVEIGSFMCETRVDIDGRYDRNRGQLSNLNMSPQNFNLINEVYSQKDNFFNYRIIDDDLYKQDSFANQITWSKEKTTGEEIDTWTNITVANTLDMNGKKGKITAIENWNDNLICFQEKAISQLMFNSRVQIPASDGVPIEITNGYKMDGSRLLNDNIGCSNKWSIVNTSMGLYFLDSNTDSIYLFNGELNNISRDRGMDWWTRGINTSKVWSPVYSSDNISGIRTFYDSKYGDIYFTPGPVFDEKNQPDAMCYSEKLGQFVSRMSYGGIPAMFNFADGFYSLKEDNGNIKLYQNNVGDYNDFYGNPKGWSFSFISNENPTLTKIFDTVELRADYYSIGNTPQLLHTCPVKYIKVENEYQNTDIVPFNESTMRKKFRVWRGVIPRSSKVAAFSDSHKYQSGLDITRNKFGRARIRNPWAMITLGWEPQFENESDEDYTKKAVIHDVSVKYTV